MTKWSRGFGANLNPEDIVWNILGINFNSRDNIDLELFTAFLPAFKAGIASYSYSSSSSCFQGSCYRPCGNTINNNAKGSGSIFVNLYLEHHEIVLYFTDHTIKVLSYDNTDGFTVKNQFEDI